MVFQLFFKYPCACKYIMGEKNMNSFDVSNLKAGTYFTSDVELDNAFILLNANTPLTASLIAYLRDWKFTKIFSDGNVSIANELASSVLNQEKSSNTTVAAINENIKSSIDLEFEGVSDTLKSDSNRLSIVKSVYNGYLNYITTVYNRYATHTELNIEELSSTVKDLCIFVRENRRHVLRAIPTIEASDKEFLVSHSMRSTVFAITIGIQLKLSLNKLIDLGVACIVHEIGMLGLPPYLYTSNHPLAPSEKKLIYTHPILSYNILKDHNFPLSISLAALEHHEKEDGSGYPRKIDGTKISMYAKIIAVACSYEAITARRNYKKEQTSYEAMVQMLKNTGNQYNEVIIKALLYSMSLFPIGSYVYLSNGKMGLIIDANPEDPQKPIIQLLDEKTETGAPKILKSEDDEAKIVRVLTNSEIIDLLKSTKKK